MTTATQDGGDGDVPAVSLVDAGKTYYRGAPVRALDDVSLTLPRGSFTAIMGPSGSGKSTLMNLVGCLDTATDGSVRVDGREVTGLSDRERTAIRGEEVGFVFQTFNLMPRLSALENVTLPLVFRGWSRAARNERARELLDQVGLGDRADHRPSELSGGQRQRVAVARALANDPAIILADEPTGNLDTETGDQILALFDRLHEDGHTILVVTHERHVAEHADRIVHLVDGTVERVESVATPRVRRSRGDAPSQAIDTGHPVAEFAESARLSWRAIRDHSLRSGLTTLGIVIGVAAVITLVTLGTSLQAAIIGDIAGGTSPEMAVYASPAGSESPGGGNSVAVFTEHDVAQLRTIPGVESVVPRGVAQVSTLQYRDRTVAWQGVTATTPAAFDGRSFAAGRPFEQGAAEIVVNQPAASLFRPNVSVGDRVTVRLGSGRAIDATVVGIVDASDDGGPFDRSVPPQVYVPTDPFYGTTVERPTTRTVQRAYPQVTVRATDFESVPAVESRVEAYLDGDSDASRLVPNSYDLVVRTNEQLADRIQEVLRTFTGFITGIAVISLIVGSIGIANIMLVSVTERTREIGIMKAVGARRRDILQLFLIEAVILGIVGAIVGTGVGIVGGYAAAEYVDIPLVFAPEWFGVAVAVGIVVGVVAGVYPAWDAARVDPIDALRYE